MDNSKIKKATVLTGSSLLAILAILAIQLGWLSNLIASINQPNIGAANAPVQMNNSMKMLNDALIAASDAVNPTIVSISVISEVSSNNMQFDFRGFEDFFNFSPFGGEEFNEKPDRRQRGGGSGVIISNDGYIVTNCHVVKGATDDGITVTTWDKKEYQAKLIGSDSLSDLAVIKIEASDLKVAHFGNADSLKRGMMVIAVGNPLGLSHTVTQGIISALGREQLGMINSPYSIENYIQTDAAINPGNSGGGLFDLNGSLIGINTMIASTTGGFVGYGFAIPIDLVKVTVQDIIATGRVNYGYLGVQVTNIDDKFAQHFGLSKVEGVLVQGFSNDDSQAKKAGVQEEDVILEVNGKPIKTLAELRGTLTRYRAGDEVTLTLWRDKKKITKKVKLEGAEGTDLANIKPKTGADDDQDSNENGTVEFEKLGFTIEPLTSDLKKSYELETGVYVSTVKRFSPAAERNLSPGIVTKIDREEVKTTGQFKKIIDSKKSGETVLLNLNVRARNGIVNVMVVLEIP